MIKRPVYLKQLTDFIDTPFIKVITGIRRCGKSTVLQLLQEALLARGVAAERIIFINFESFAFSSLTDAEQLYTHVQEQITSQERHYLLLDEIQEVAQWEKAVNAFMVDFQVDIYLTGSNSHLLSSELSTHIAGRYVEIPIYTLSFREFLEFKSCYGQREQPADRRQEFNEYLRKGGFPVVHAGNYDAESAYKIVQDIYASVLLRDTVQRHNIRDVELLERIVTFAFDNVGNTFSGKNVADYFKSQQRGINVNTVYNYLKALESAFVLHRVERYDIRGKGILKTQEKFYLGDVSLLYARMGFRTSLISGLLENLVYLELRRQGFSVHVGKVGTREVDFIAEKRGEKRYLQVAYKLESAQTVEREFSVLQSIHDNWPKYVVTMDELWSENLEGIQHIHIADFLLGTLNN